MRVNRQGKKETTKRLWQVAVRSENKGFVVKKQLVKKLASAILSSLDEDLFSKEICEVSILFVTDEYIAALNLEYRGKGRATDVLSFSQLEGVGPSLESLGDVVISLDRALLQAKERHLTLSLEVARLLIHGLLHLAGFDHVAVAATRAAKMRRLERQLWRNFAGDFAKLAATGAAYKSTRSRRSKASRK